MDSVPVEDELEQICLRSRLPKDVLESMSDEQKIAVGKAIAQATWDATPVDIRFSVPFFARRYFITVVSGRENRSRDRRKEDRVAHPLATTGNTMFFLGFAGVSLALAIGAAMFFTGQFIPSIGDLPFATIYLFSFAITATSILLLMLYGMEKRRRMDGTPWNKTLLKLGSVISAILWLLSIIPHWTDTIGKQ